MNSLVATTIIAIDKNNNFENIMVAVEVFETSIVMTMVWSNRSNSWM